MTWKGPWLLRGWRLVQWSVDLVVFLAHSLLSQYTNWQQMTSSPAPDSSTLRTPGSLEDLASLCQRGRGDLSCTWGVFGVQLVFFSGMQIQMSSMCKDRGVICSQGGMYVWPEAPTLTSMCRDQPREKVHRWRSLGVVTGTNETAGAQQCRGTHCAYIRLRPSLLGILGISRV